MKKKIIDLTKEEAGKICDSCATCENCPLNIKSPVLERVCWLDFLQEEVIKNVENEVEVLEDVKD